MRAVDETELLGLSQRRGFTLLELLVALLVGSTAILGARMVLGTIVDRHRVSFEEQQDHASTSNGARLLRQLLLEAQADAAASFGGDGHEMSFASWCLTPRGWSERCGVTLRLEPVTGDLTGVQIAAMTTTGDRLILFRASTPARFAYLEDAAHGGTWTERWGPSSTPPRAVGIFVPDDTLILRTGEQP